MAALRTLAAASVVAAIAGCAGPRAPAPPTLASTAAGDDLTLYRDAAVVRQRVELTLPPGSSTTTIEIASGVLAGDIVILERGGLEIAAIHGAITAQPIEPIPAEPARAPGSSDDTEIMSPRPSSPPTPVRLDVRAPRAGTYPVVLGYTTDKLRWDVAYTMTASPARDRGELRGALAIRNDTGLTLRASRARVVDADLVPWRTKTAERLAADLVGAAQGSTLPATPRELGAITLGDGETRVDVMREIARRSSRRMRSVLVYDPVGTRLDNPGASPLRDVSLGTERAVNGTRVTESFEVMREERGSTGLPAGPVRLLAERADGAVSVLGEARLFEASTRVSVVDTIAVGTADGVTGTRERRELTIDDENRRLVEEFVITLDNQRDHGVEVLVREHLYRGQNWTLAYHSAPEASKEGPQQIALRVQVPARSKQKILYVVVYTWGQ